MVGISASAVTAATDGELEIGGACPATEGLENGAAATDDGRLTGAAATAEGVDTGEAPIAAAIDADDIGGRGAAAGTARTPDGVAAMAEGLLRGTSENRESSSVIGAPAGGAATGAAGLACAGGAAARACAEAAAGFMGRVETCARAPGPAIAPAPARGTGPPAGAGAAPVGAPAAAVGSGGGAATFSHASSRSVCGSTCSPHNAFGNTMRMPGMRPGKT